MENENVILINNFISDEDCDYLIKTYNEKVFRSKVVDGEVHPSRTSSTFYMPNNDPVCVKLREKTAEFLKIPIDNIESLQFLRYIKGERYLYHYDYLSTPNITNQRVHTILLYLNTLNEEDGGATSFWHYKKKVSPVKGMGVWFRNLNQDGSLNTQSMHAGEEILTEGTIKYAVNIWTRQHKI